MIGIAILIGATIAAVGAVAKFWKDIREWILRGAKKVAEIVKGVVYGVRVFAKKMREAFKEISKHYSKDRQGNWEETTVTRNIPENEVPAEILAVANQSTETDITKKLELEIN